MVRTGSFSSRVLNIQNLKTVNKIIKSNPQMHILIKHGAENKVDMTLEK
jgi:hypothetical protein